MAGAAQTSWQTRPAPLPNPRPDCGKAPVQPLDFEEHEGSNEFNRETAQKEPQVA